MMEIEERSTPAPESPRTMAPKPPKPDNQLVWAILTTLLCCLPFGIVSIVYASQVDSKWSVGDQEGAIDASRRARNWAIGSAVAAVVIYLALIAFYVAIFVFAVGAASL